MSIYDYNIAVATRNILPPSKRKKINLALLGVPASVLQYQRDLLFDTYADGFGGDVWTSVPAFTKGNRVRYVDNGVYEALKSVPANTPPTAANVYPTGTYWLKIQDNWIGSRERTYYNGQLIVLELILNKYFNVGNFAFPWKGASHANQLYITRAPSISNTMWMGQDSRQSNQSYMARESKNAKSFMPQVAGAANDSRFTIYVPSATYTAIGATIPSGSPDTAEVLIRALADKYIRANRNYTVTQY